MRKRVVICGFGFMGQTHAGNILKTNELELAGIVTRSSRKKLKPVAGNLDAGSLDWSRLEKIPFFTTLPEALDNCAFDAAVIAVPTALHADFAMECIRHGKHIFLEKPICANQREAAEIIAASAEKNIICHIGHCLRLFPAYRFLQQIYTEKSYGKLKYLKLFRRTAVPDWGAWKNMDTSLEAITGPVFDLNIHDIDFALHLTGLPENLTARKEAYDSKLFRVNWQSADGTLIEIEGGFAGQAGFAFRAGFMAYFEKAIVEYSTDASEPLVIACNGKSEAVKLPDDDAYQLEIQAFAQALNSEKACCCTPGEAAQALEICLKTVESLNSAGNDD